MQKSVYAVIRCPQINKYLLGLDAVTGTWTCFGGEVREEGIVQTLYRALYEEASLYRKDLEDKGPLGRLVTKNGEHVYYEIQTVAPVSPQLSPKYQGYIWAAKDQILEMFLHPRFLRVAESIFEEQPLMLEASKRLAAKA